MQNFKVKQKNWKNKEHSEGNKQLTRKQGNKILSLDSEIVKNKGS